MKRVKPKENELYILPSTNDEMKLFVDKFKVDMMEHIVSSITFAIQNKLPIVEVFQFKNSPFVITIAEKEYKSNIEHINKYYVDNEIYELCPRVEELRKTITNKTDEKEKQDNPTDNNS